MWLRIQCTLGKFVPNKAYTQCVVCYQNDACLSQNQNSYFYQITTKNSKNCVIFHLGYASVHPKQLLLNFYRMISYVPGMMLVISDFQKFTNEWFYCNFTDVIFLVYWQEFFHLALCPKPYHRDPLTLCESLIEISM